MRTFALRFGVILAVSAAMTGIGACGAEGGDVEDAGADVTVPDSSGKDATPDRSVPSDASDASDVKSDKPAVPDADGAPPVDAKPDVYDAADAKVDADLPPEGSPCTSMGSVQSRACGGCGTQERVCLDLGSGMVWQAWGSCKNEVVGGCTPGSVSFEACDLCGRRRRECTSACTWITGICENQNPNACEPGLVDWVGELSCATGSGRTRVCSSIDLDAAVDAAQTGCVWGSYSTTCSPPPTGANIPTTVGEQTGLAIQLGTTTMPYVSGNSTVTDAGGCTITTSTSSTYQVPYTYFELNNPTAKTATVTIWGTLTADSGTYDGIRIIAYAGTSNPPTSLTSCLSADGCYSSAANCKLDAGFGLSVDGGTLANEGGTLAPYYSPKVTIPAGGKIVLLVSEYYNSYAYTTLPSIWVRTDELK